MSEITETEIKSMTKEQNYMRGYKDGKSDVLDKIRAEITTLQNRCYSLTKGTMCAFCKFECKYRAESEDEE